MRNRVKITHNIINNYFFFIALFSLHFVSLLIIIIRTSKLSHFPGFVFFSPQVLLVLQNYAILPRSITIPFVLFQLFGKAAFCVYFHTSLMFSKSGLFLGWHLKYFSQNSADVRYIFYLNSYIHFMSTTLLLSWLLN